MDEYAPTDIPKYRREGIAPGPIFELNLDADQTLVLANRAIELFRADRPIETNRFHVRHIAVEVKPKRNGNFRLKMGLRRDGGIWNLCEAEVPPEKMPEVGRFFEEARKEVKF